MKISEVARLLNAKVLCGEEYMDRDVVSACGSDMMSDVLAFVKDHAVLLTGLVNPQVIRTAEMMDVLCIVFVRGKLPDQTMIDMADGRQLVLMSTSCRMFNACGLLYEAGLGGGSSV